MTPGEDANGAFATNVTRVTAWRGVTRIFIQTQRKGGLGTLDFDLKCVLDALRRPGVCLVLGYNGAAFLPLMKDPKFFGRARMVGSTTFIARTWKPPSF